MLSYRHSYHAGNHADVLKHTILLQLLEHLGKKDKAYWVVDTHAGAGLYALDSPHAEKLGEYREGIGRLWERSDLPLALAHYVAQVRACNPDGSLRAYPGSPWLTQQALRSQDRLRLCELHSTDLRLLDEYLGHTDKQTQIFGEDGFSRLKALLPPPSRLGLVLIDPSYELREDYARVCEALKDSLSRFATGTYAIWFPLLSRPESRHLASKLKTIAGRDWLYAAFCVREPQAEGSGMYGSGMFIVNPPWTLAKTLELELPFLQKTLAQGPGAHHVLEQHVS
ncbi:MAG: 23S rRNA (adenine(2030)-N(6))-methyltransferase RlmJ [Candidatus Dactylopiibacterium carminicum]|nr:MAG: 23S rRNA (adenine(2030)-N(6))-methyltransferase RlmJ [Candidatus Dactylopiibacterium carminicum]